MNTTKETQQTMNTESTQSTQSTQSAESTQSAPAAHSPESTHAQIKFVNFSEDYGEGNEEVVTFEMPKLPSWEAADLIGYTPNTTFWDDFSIADIFGIEAIIDTFERAFSEWKEDVRYISELSLVLNHKGIYYSDSRPMLSNAYLTLWERLHRWAQNYYTGEDAEYYFSVTD